MVDASVVIRNAVRPYLEKLEAGDSFLVAVSGGADSLALAAALLIESKELALTPIAITIDHQLQENSHDQAERVSTQLKEFGYGQVIVKKVVVTTESGIEAGARDARYAALVESAEETKAVKIFLGHTRDDQAETVLLGLARGSGARSLSGMAAESGLYVRPLLGITREETEAACKELKLDFWNDPHNLNTNFTRVRVRREVIPYLERELDPGISRALVRTGALLRDDADALDQWADREGYDLDCDRLAALPRAIRTRIIRKAALEAGSTPGQLTFEQVGAIDALICAWKGQGAVSLAGGVKVERISGRLSLSR
ncbi:MAG: tRNA lysidine(34) synthetase TilS [Candidatus Planktophila sp.]